MGRADRGVEDTLHLLGQAWRKAVGLAARALDASAEVMREEAGVVLGGPSSLKAARDRDWGRRRPERGRCAWGWPRSSAGKSGWRSTSAWWRRCLLCRTSCTRAPRGARRTPHPTRTVARGASASRSRWPRLGASPLRRRTCDTVGKAAPQRSTACRNTACWTGIVLARARAWSAQRTSQRLQPWSCWSRRWSRR